MHWAIFVLGTVILWGSYGPALHSANMTLGSPIRAMLFIGFAYFMVAVLVPAIILAVSENPPGSFNSKGMILGTFAGILGSLGAVCIVFSFANGGSPLYVMPLVFGGAPIINVLVSLALHPPKEAPDWRLFLGFAFAALGAFMVLRYKPN